MPPYDPFRPSVTDSWNWPAQVAIWRERALHQAQRAEFYKRLVEAEQTGATVNASDKEPAL